MITLKITPSQAKIMIDGLAGDPPTRSGRLVGLVSNVSLGLEQDLRVSGRPTANRKGAYAFKHGEGKKGYLRRRELEQLYRWLLLAHRSAAGSIRGQIKRNVNKVCDLLKIDIVQRLADIQTADAWLKDAKKARPKKTSKGRGESPPERQSCSPHCLPALGAHSALCRARQARASSS